MDFAGSSSSSSSSRSPVEVAIAFTRLLPEATLLLAANDGAILCANEPARAALGIGGHLSGLTLYDCVEDRSVATACLKVWSRSTIFVTSALRFHNQSTGEMIGLRCKGAPLADVEVEGSPVIVCRLELGRDPR